MRTKLVLGAACLLVACNGPEARVAPVETSARQEPAPPAATTPAGPTPDPITHPCVVEAAQYDIAIEKGSDACQSDADCGCYQGGIGKSGCGGVLNQESVRKLAEIAKRFHDMKCRRSVNCAAWACQPRCEGGHCRR
jgi:hypothetical protein